MGPNRSKVGLETLKFPPEVIKTLGASILIIIKNRPKMLFDLFAYGPVAPPPPPPPIYKAAEFGRGNGWEGGKSWEWCVRLGAVVTTLGHPSNKGPDGAGVTVSTATANG